MLYPPTLFWDTQSHAVFVGVRRRFSVTIYDYLQEAVDALRGTVPPEDLYYLEHLMAQKRGYYQAIRPTGWNRCVKNTCR